MRAHVIVRLNFPSERRLKIVLSALQPETKTPPSFRSKVKVEGAGTTLTLSFEASDTSALRAALNSYLRWINVVNDSCLVLDSIRKEQIENT
jgi:tRNA threonylcarbamoyladenosine modification (KEOPS) complex  Pcc1 subunit